MKPWTSIEAILHGWRSGKGATLPNEAKKDNGGRYGFGRRAHRPDPDAEYLFAPSDHRLPRTLTKAELNL